MILYAVTIFLSAFLLFQVQPLIAKVILPWFGGSAAVWTTCMLFFQLLLLAGYVYSHAYVRLRGPARRHIHIPLPVRRRAAPHPGPSGGGRVWGLLSLRARVRDARLAEQRRRGAGSRGRRYGCAGAGPESAVGGARGLRFCAAPRLYQPYDAQYR